MYTYIYIGLRSVNGSTAGHSTLRALLDPRASQEPGRAQLKIATWVRDASLSRGKGAGVLDVFLFFSLLLAFRCSHVIDVAATAQGSTRIAPWR